MALRSLGRDCPRFFKAGMGHCEGRRRTELSTLRGSCLTYFFPGGNLCSWERDCKPTHATLTRSQFAQLRAPPSFPIESVGSSLDGGQERAAGAPRAAAARAPLGTGLRPGEGPPHRPGLRTDPFPPHPAMGAVSALSIIFFVGYPTHFFHPGIRLEQFAGSQLQ